MVCDCGTTWTFLLPFLPFHVIVCQADDSCEMSVLLFLQIIIKMKKILLAAIVICTLRINI